MSAGGDYEVEYNNRARVPEHPALIAGWAKDAAAYRERHPPRSIPYGSGARNIIDFFPADQTARLSFSFTAVTGRRWTVLSSATSQAG